MALKMRRISIFMPRLIEFAPITPLPFYLSTLFSTLAETNKTLPCGPFADLATTTFNLSSADIAHILKFAPSLDNPKTLRNVERFANVLTKHGFTQHEVARIMRSQPKTVTINAEKLVEPKIELLKNMGIEEKDLPKLILKVPAYLSSNLQDGLLPKIAFLKNLFQSQELLLKAVKLNPRILTYSLEKNLKPSLAFWEGCGFEKEELVRFLSSKPFLLLFSSLTPPKVDLIRKIGICKESKMYKNVLCVVAPARVETLQSKMDDFGEWGLSDEEILELFRTSPSVFNLSKDKLREKMEFVVSTMQLPPNYVVKHNGFLRYSLEKSIRPRYEVFQHTKSLKGVEHLKSKQMYSLISMSEANFFDKILKGHPELESLYALHKKAIPNV